jgi:hypothetical protein
MEDDKMREELESMLEDSRKKRQEKRREKIGEVLDQSSSNVETGEELNEVDEELSEEMDVTPSNPLGEVGDLSDDLFDFSSLQDSFGNAFSIKLDLEKFFRDFKNENLPKELSDSFYFSSGGSFLKMKQILRTNISEEGDYQVWVKGENGEIDMAMTPSFERGSKLGTSIPLHHITDYVSKDCKKKILMKTF